MQLFIVNVSLALFGIDLLDEKVLRGLPSDAPKKRERT
jgi:hypothetical protein